MFVDQNGKEYTEDSILDIYSNIVLTPRYINAGYFPIEDKFGDVASLKMVYIPESEREYYASKPGFSIGVKNQNSDSVQKVYSDYWPVYTGAESDVTFRQATYASDVKIPACFVGSYFITNGFMKKILALPYVTYNKGDSSNSSAITPAHIIVTNPHTSGVMKFVFRSPNMLSHGIDTLGAGNTAGEAPVGSISPVDLPVLANLLTCIYNIENYGKTQLTYAYVRTANNTIPFIDAWGSTFPTNGVGALGNVNIFGYYYENGSFSPGIITVKDDATGYRFMTFDLYNYCSHLITDDRQIPWDGTPGSSYNLTYNLVLKKSAKFGKNSSRNNYISNKKYNYKASYDGADKSDYFYGSAAGLASYNTSTGDYNRNTFRLGYVAVGRDSGNFNLSGNLNAQYVSNPDRNTINGCGITFHTGQMGQWFPDGKYVKLTELFTKKDKTITFDTSKIFNGTYVTSSTASTSHGQSGALVNEISKGVTNFSGINQITSGSTKQTICQSREWNFPYVTSCFNTGYLANKNYFRQHYGMYKKIAYGAYNYYQYSNVAATYFYNTKTISSKTVWTSSAGYTTYLSNSASVDPDRSNGTYFSARFYRLAK